ncbi:MAG: hypothetical protein CM1200mP14_23380 [Gammaproteobacteria bacterium]|nr:MAG: hypothetical protein CM1200mP14_23380 [Gammaproteobacteria bacterium]
MRWNSRALFTDAMDMSAISRGFGAEEASVRAIEAGADVIFMPPSVERAVEGSRPQLNLGALRLAGLTICSPGFRDQETDGLG